MLDLAGAHFHFNPHLVLGRDLMNISMLQHKMLAGYNVYSEKVSKFSFVWYKVPFQTVVPMSRTEFLV